MYLGMTVTDQNYIHEEIKSCCFLSKTMKIKIQKPNFTCFICMGVKLGFSYSRKSIKERD
jgi:hypothetical protein